MSGLRVDLFDMLKEQSSMSFPLTVSYTPPALLSSDKGSECIVLSFERKLFHVKVKGSLASNLETEHELGIDNSILLPSICHFWEEADIHGRLSEKNPTKAYTEGVILEFWKSAKDDLVLPLMIDLCEKTGLNLPPCFMELPGHLKYQILELLSGRETATVGKELSTLSSNDELWKGKYVSEYDIWLREKAKKFKELGGWSADNIHFMH